eukprot:scaffold395749_cov55-Attheya_sp.AAC.2
MQEQNPPSEERASQDHIALFKEAHFSVEDIASGKEDPADSSAFTVVGTYDAGASALDGISYHNGVAMVTDQLNAKVILVVHVDIYAEKPASLVSVQHGYLMLHGVVISKVHDHMAIVTSYSMETTRSLFSQSRKQLFDEGHNTRWWRRGNIE